MNDYDAPLEAISLALEVSGSTRSCRSLNSRNVDRESVHAVHSDFGRFAAEVIPPTDRVGDTCGAGFDRSNASLALQVHGGMGYVEDTGVAQRLRDSRIAPIYDGTDGYPGDRPREPQGRARPG